MEREEVGMTWLDTFTRLLLWTMIAGAGLVFVVLFVEAW